MTKEIFKPIPGYENYKVSNHGNIYSEISGRKLKPGRDSYGYMQVCLCKKGQKPLTSKVHRLVLSAFQGPSDLDVNHKNGVKDDNNLENLEYCTRAENIRHAVKTGLSSPFGQAPIKLEACKDGDYVGEFLSQADAARALKLDNSTISKIVNGHLKTTGGYTFKRKDKKL